MLILPVVEQHSVLMQVQAYTQVMHYVKLIDLIVLSLKLMVVLHNQLHVLL